MYTASFKRQLVHFQPSTTVNPTHKVIFRPRLTRQPRRYPSPDPSCSQQQQLSDAVTETDCHNHTCRRIDSSTQISDCRLEDLCRAESHRRAVELLSILRHAIFLCTWNFQKYDIGAAMIWRRISKFDICDRFLIFQQQILLTSYINFWHLTSILISWI